MPNLDNFALPKLLGYLYTEVFASKAHNPNKPINRGVHKPEDQLVLDDMKTRLIASTVVWQWGPGGASDETNASPSSARWSFTAEWG